MKSVFAVALLLFVSIATAGSLTPPGAPSATFKTLDEVEAGTPITQEMIPLTITGSGRYYLVESITFSGSGAAITIQAPGVLLDLNGFVIDGLDATSTIPRQGIVATRYDLSVPPAGFIRNGIIRRMSYGGIVAIGYVIENVEVLDVAGTGILLNCGQMRHCIVQTVTRSKAGPMPGLGIEARGSIVENCIVNNVTGALGTTTRLAGIDAYDFSTIRNCKVSRVIDEDSFAIFYEVAGIVAINGSVIEGCTVDYVMGLVDQPSDRAIGIMAGHQSFVSSVTIRGNRVMNIYHGGRAVGIFAQGQGCRVVENEVMLVPLTIPSSTSVGISVGRDTVVERNVVDIEEMTNSVSLTQRGMEIGRRSIAQENKINLRQSPTSTGRTAIGIYVIDNDARILSNIVWVESPVGIAVTGNTIVFESGTVMGYAAANVMNRPLVDLGTNTMGTVPAPNHPLGP